MAGLSQQELADKIGVKRSTYAYWERTIVPKADELDKIAEALGVSFDEFLSKKGAPVKALRRQEQEKEGTDLTDKYIQVLEKDREFLQELVKSNMALIQANLDRAVAYSKTIFLDMSSAREVMLQSLSRLEGHENDHLLRAADKLKIALMEAEAELSKTSETGR